MAKYVCSICGYVYDEDKEGVKFDTLPESWKCPLCGASKQLFKKQVEETEQVKVKEKSEKPVKADNSQKANAGDKELSNAELNVLCTNLAKGCEKQYLAEEAGLFLEIAEYCKKHSEVAKKSDYEAISQKLNDDLKTFYAEAFESAKADGDRGALRALTWSEKVSKIVNGLIERYKKEGATFLANSKIFVCEICGFIYIGDEAPDICPICKVPKLKIHEVRRT